MQINDAGLALVKAKEGYHTRLPDGRCTTYYCIAGKLTIGWGCTEGIKQGDIWTEAQAEAALRRELAKHEGAVMRLVSVPLNENQFSALVSFSYNVGAGALAGSSLLKKLNKGDYAGAQKAFLDWNKFTNPKTKRKEYSRGLAIRRGQEAALFAESTPAEDEARGGEVAMVQAVEPPKEPFSPATKTTAGTIIGGGAVTAANSLTAGPPAGVTDAVSSIGAWQSIGKTLGSLGEAMWSNPLATVAISLLAVGAIWLAPLIWKPKS